MTKYFILSALKKKEMHGYELMTELEKITGKKPSTSQIYPVLKKMTISGFLVSAAKKDGRKKIKVYKITGSGIRLYSSISARFDSIINAALRDKIKTCSHCRCEILSGAVKKKIGKAVHYFCCESCAGSFVRER